MIKLLLTLILSYSSFLLVNCQSEIGNFDLTVSYGYGLSYRKVKVNPEFIFPSSVNSSLLAETSKYNETSNGSKTLGFEFSYKHRSRLAFTAGFFHQAYSRTTEYSVFSDLIDPRRPPSEDLSLLGIKVSNIDNFLFCPVGLTLDLFRLKRVLFFSQIGIGLNYYFLTKTKTSFYYQDYEESGIDKKKLDEYRTFNFSPFFSTGLKVQICSSLKLTSSANFSTFALSNFKQDYPLIQRWQSLVFSMGLVYDIK